MFILHGESHAFNYKELKEDYGIGSYPPEQKGLHLRILLKDKKIPFKRPCFFKACIVYTEQVG